MTGLNFTLLQDFEPGLLFYTQPHGREVIVVH